MKKVFLPGMLLCSCASVFAEPALEEILVTAELIERGVLELPGSVTVIDQSVIEQRNAQHLEDLLSLAPNVNFATGASRGRFIQIRGIGERSEFQEPINNSVGVVVDGIDLTGVATAVSTLDIQQVEVLRGPQGTQFGANALAGLINIVTNKPTETLYANLTTSVEDYDGFEVSGVISGPISEDSGFRFAAKHYQSNGFIEDVFLDRDDTNNIDETTARALYTARVSDALTLDFSVFLADIDNGFDAFSLDNTRQTFSDEPGSDRQETTAGSINAKYAISESLSFEGLVSAADSDLQYSFDEDWSHVGICENTACDSELFGFDWFYSSFDNYVRENKNTSVDLRLVSQQENSAWVLGVYNRDQGVDLDRIYTFADSDFASQNDTKNTAVYGQFDFSFNDRWSATTGLRLEQRDVDYSDNNGSIVSTDEDLWGGRFALEYRAQNGALIYGLVSRGYKAGGFNLDATISAAEREFDTETMLNFEVGVKHSFDTSNGVFQFQASVFHQDRDDIQTKQSIVRSLASGESGGPCPCGFTDFTDNAASGTNQGIELQLGWVVNSRVALNASLGILDTEFDRLLTFDHVNADRDNGVAFDLGGREQAHAPGYQFSLGASLQLSESITLSGSIDGKDDFFFSDRHEERSDAYELLNLELSYQADNWSLALYGKNLTDELVKTRGFGSFGNDPRNFYETEPYNQFGAPRLLGVRASIDF